MPIMLAKGQRASRASVASDRLASVGYCSSKNTFFHGVKLHVVAQQRSGTLPLPQQAGLTPGSENDLRALRRVLPKIEGGVLCGDKAYCDGPLKERLSEDQDLDLLTRCASFLRRGTGWRGDYAEWSTPISKNSPLQRCPSPSF